MASASGSGVGRRLEESSSGLDIKLASQSSASGAQVEAPQPQGEGVGAKKRKHRGGKKRRNRRQSFAAPTGQPEGSHLGAGRPSLLDVPGHSGTQTSLYRHGNVSNASIESQGLLDHRDQGSGWARRQSIQHSSRPTLPYSRSSGIRQQAQSSHPNIPETFVPHATADDDHTDENNSEADDHTPLLPSFNRNRPAHVHGIPGLEYGGLDGEHERRQRSRSSSRISRRLGRSATGLGNSFTSHNVTAYDVNNPPSVPASPELGPDGLIDDVMIMGDESQVGSLNERYGRARSTDAVIDVDKSAVDLVAEMRRAATLPAEADVCFPSEGLSEMGDHDYMHLHGGDSISRQRRRRSRRWPDLRVLEKWSIEEKEQRTLEGVRAKKVNEPVLVGGRLRPQKVTWHRQIEDEPYRWTYFNETFQSTIHSQTISELLQPDQSFRDLFIPEPPELSENSEDEEDEDLIQHDMPDVKEEKVTEAPLNGHLRGSSQDTSANASSHQSTKSPDRAEATPTRSQSETLRQQAKSYGERPTFWLDVLSPTEPEMRVLQKAFGIHGLTVEDIMMKEDREKVELFRHYYFVSYRSFEQDMSSENYLEPINIYVIVFREGVLSFHHSMTPHPANVRRRMRQLRDYLVLTSDWISYGIIDDITDAYAPLIQRIEEEVDKIDEAILTLHSSNDSTSGKSAKEKANFQVEKCSDSGVSATESGTDMLRRVGEWRKKVMTLYRLLGNKADVIKGFAKRCNSQWEVAPKSEIGFYLGDIQDHIVTMTSNLSHYENLLSRAHSNYLAQINISMNERQEKTADVLGKLTVLGTIVLPMNIVTGMWGMNVLVPGQDVDSLWWFWSITAGLIFFGLTSFFVAKRVYGIV